MPGQWKYYRFQNPQIGDLYRLKGEVYKVVGVQKVQMTLAQIDRSGAELSTSPIKVRTDTGKVLSTYNDYLVHDKFKNLAEAVAYLDEQDAFKAEKSLKAQERAKQAQLAREQRLERAQRANFERMVADGGTPSSASNILFPPELFSLVFNNSIGLTGLLIYEVKKRVDVLNWDTHQYEVGYTVNPISYTVDKYAYAHSGEVVYQITSQSNYSGTDLDTVLWEIIASIGDF